MDDTVPVDGLIDLIFRVTKLIQFWFGKALIISKKQAATVW